MFLQRIPLLVDVQSAWSLLLHCAGGRANHMLRVVYNARLWESLRRILKLDFDVDNTVKDISSLPLAMEDLGSAVQVEPVNLRSGTVGPTASP